MSMCRGLTPSTLGMIGEVGRSMECGSSTEARAGNGTKRHSKALPTCAAEPGSCLCIFRETDLEQRKATAVLFFPYRLEKVSEPGPNKTDARDSRGVGENRHQRGHMATCSQDSNMLRIQRHSPLRVSALISPALATGCTQRMWSISDITQPRSGCTG